jgi:hypothetical protein
MDAAVFSTSSSHRNHSAAASTRLKNGTKMPAVHSCICIVYLHCCITCSDGHSMEESAEKISFNINMAVNDIKSTSTASFLN